MRWDGATGGLVVGTKAVHHYAVQAFLFGCLALVFISARAFGQGQIVFSTKVGMVVDAPIMMVGTQRGLGPEWTAQLFLLGGGSLTPLLPTTTFRQAGTGALAIADRYIVPVDVTIPRIQPGEPATVVLIPWLTSLGSLQATRAAGWNGESLPLTVHVGGGLLPPANLAGLQGFLVYQFPEPSPGTLLAAGAALFACMRFWRKWKS